MTWSEVCSTGGTASLNIMPLGLSSLLGLLPAGNAGLAVKVGLSLVGIAWWTSGPGAEEARCEGLSACVCGELGSLLHAVQPAHKAV
jgi:hypothetical protein